MERKENENKIVKEQENQYGNIMRMKIPKDGVCCPLCRGKKIHTKVPMQCCLPTIEFCDSCGKDFVIEGDEILYFV